MNKVTAFIEFSMFKLLFLNCKSSRTTVSPFYPSCFI